MKMNEVRRIRHSSIFKIGPPSVNGLFANSSRYTKKSIEGLWNQGILFDNGVPTYKIKEVDSSEVLHMTTFRQKIIAFLIIAATFPVLLLGLLSIKTYQKEMVVRIDELNARSATLTASQISDFLNDVKRSLQLSAQLIPFDSFGKEDLSDALKIPYRQFDFINIAALFDADGRKLTAPAYEENPNMLDGLEKHESIIATEFDEFTRNVPFAEASAQGFAFGSPYYSPRLKTPRMAVAVSLPNTNGQGWILAAEISLRDLARKVRRIRPAFRGESYIVDQEGRVIYHDDESLMRLRASLTFLGIVADGISRKASLTKRYTARNGTEMVGAYSPIAESGWGLVVSQPMDEAFASVKKMRNTTAIWVLIGLTAAVLGGIILSLGLSAPIRALAEYAGRITEGKLGERIDIKAHGEIAQLAAAFNRMSSALQSSFDTIVEQKEEIARWNEELQARVKERTRELREAEEQIIRSEKMAAVAELSAGMAHEINNPLTSVLGFSQLMLRQTEPDHKFNQYLNAISNGAKRIRTIVDDMLRFSRGSENADFTQVDLNLIIKSAHHLVMRQLSERRIQSEMSLKESLPMVQGDLAELQQVFIHLFNNAKNAMPNGGILKVVTEEVEGGAVKVLVVDSGVGIKEENLSKIFNPFFTTKDEWGKTGVGLSVVDRIVREHNGKISVVSKQGQGATFSVYLPGVPRTTHLS
jgi:signal transduction histidine kinase